MLRPSPHQVHRWKQVSGALTRISAGSVTNVWGVNSSGNIYRYTGDDGNPWVQPGPGAFVDIGAGADGSVWGVNSVRHIYRYSSNRAQWAQVNGKLVAISAGVKTNVWGGRHRRRRLHVHRRY